MSCRRTRPSPKSCPNTPHIHGTKTRTGSKTDLHYLRSIFGPVCPVLEPANADRWKKRKRTFLRPKYFEDLRTHQIAAFITQKVIEDGIAPKTANRYREVIMRVFTWAIKQRGIRVPGGRNPVADVERYPTRAPEIRFLTLPEIEDQLEVLAEQGQIQTMAALYIYAGLRREEGLWLTVKDIDFDAGRYGMIRVRAKTVLGEYWEPKTKRNRAVPISSRLRQYLDEYAPPRAAGGWYFPSPKGKRWNLDNFSDHLRQANRKANLTWSCQDFRHTFASHMARRNESLYKISTLMGNSPEICRKHYAALMPESLVDCVEFDEPRTDAVKSKVKKSTERPYLRLIVNNER